MKPLQNKILVAVDLRQKSDYEFETDGGLVLWCNSKFGFDNKVSSPVIARVVSPGKHTDVAEGDYVLCNHNTFNMLQDPSGEDEDSLLGFTGIKDDRGWIFSINRSWIYFKVGSDGNPVPLSGFVVAERIPMEYDTIIEIPDSLKTNYKNQFRAIAVGPDCDGVSVGDIIITYEKSDVEVNYTFNRKNVSFVRIKMENILATSNEVYG
jgi:hypothetical protein